MTLALFDTKLGREVRACNAGDGGDGRGFRGEKTKAWSKRCCTSMNQNGRNWWTAHIGFALRGIFA